MSKQLREEFESVRSVAIEVIGKAKNENRDLTAEEKQENEKRFARCNQIKAQLEDEAKFASLKAPAEVPADVIDFVKGNPPENKAKKEFEASHGGKLTADRHRDAANEFIRTGHVPQDLYTIVAGAGGVTLPTAQPVLLKRNRNPIKAALQYYGLPVLNYPGDTNIAVFDDSACTGVVIAQDSTAHNICEPSVTQFTGDSLVDSQAIWFSNTLLLQSGYDYVSQFRPLLDARIEDKEISAWTTTITTGGGAATVGSTAATTTGVSYQDLVDLKYSIPSTFNDGVFFVSRGLMAAIEGMVDDNGRPLYRDSLSDDAPDKLLGWPVFVVEALATPAAGAVSAIAASASALMAREFGARRLARYENYPLKPDQVGIRMFANHGFAFITQAVKLLKHPLS